MITDAITNVDVSEFTNVVITDQVPEITDVGHTDASLMALNKACEHKFFDCFYLKIAAIATLMTT